MVNGLIKKTIAVLTAVSLLFTLAGCGKKDEDSDRMPAAVSALSDIQMFILLASGREEVASVYSDDIFGVPISDKGETYLDNYCGIMKDYISQFAVLTDMADVRGIRITSDEKKAVSAAADRYMTDLEGCAAAPELTREDAEEALSAQLTVAKLKEELMDDIDTEISESEARVISIDLITVSTAGKAQEALDRINGGINFFTVATEYAENDIIERKVGRGDLPEALEAEVFELENDEITPIVSSGGKYYLAKCISGYDATATEARKNRLISERRSQAVVAAYREYTGTRTVELDPKKWDAAVEMLRKGMTVPDIFEYTEEF